MSSLLVSASAIFIFLVIVLQVGRVLHNGFTRKVACTGINLDLGDLGRELSLTSGICNVLPRRAALSLLPLFTSRGDCEGSLCSDCLRGSGLPIAMIEIYRVITCWQQTLSLFRVPPLSLDMLFTFIYLIRFVVVVKTPQCFPSRCQDCPTKHKSSICIFRVSYFWKGLCSR